MHTNNLAVNHKKPIFAFESTFKLFDPSTVSFLEHIVLAAPAGAPAGAGAGAGGGRICFVDKLGCDKSNKTMESSIECVI